MEECTVCVSYVFEIRETPTLVMAQGWKDHVEIAHRGALVALRTAEAMISLVILLDRIRGVLDG